MNVKLLIDKLEQIYAVIDTYTNSIRLKMTPCVLFVHEFIISCEWFTGLLIYFCFVYRFRIV